jgi:diguanylate cyclase (GGDEF)-like protein
MTRLSPEPAETKLRFYLRVLPVTIAVTVGAGIYGLVGPTTTSVTWVLPLLTAAILTGFAWRFAARPDRFEQSERILVVLVFAIVVATLVLTAALVPHEHDEYLLTLTRVGFWLPTVAAFGFLALGVRAGTLMATMLWAVLALVVLGHFVLGSGEHPRTGVVTLVESLAANGVVILVLSGFAHVTRDTEQKAAAMEAQANTDELTGLANRRHGEHALEVEVERAERYERPLSVLLFDLDFFKAVNDAHGHAAGDRVLASVRDLLKDRLRPSDLLARWGGEEFLLIAPEMREDEAARLAERLRRLVARHDFTVGWRLTASFGVAERLPQESAAELVRRADEAMYAAKRDGRDTVRLASGPGEKARPTVDLGPAPEV